MSSINGNYSLRNITLTKPYVEKPEITFLQEDDIELKFNDELELNFKLYKKNNFEFNGRYYGKNTKIIYDLNLYYQWLNAEYPPRFTFKILKNELVYLTRYLGINDSLETNNINLILIIDINNGDKLKFILKKDDLQNNTIKILDNSNYSLKIF